jgi:tRNA uridine 5-carboxymethylaminomethyl modification enzyme
MEIIPNDPMCLTVCAHQIAGHLATQERHRSAEAKRKAVEAEIARLDKVILHPSPELNGLLAEYGLGPIEHPVSARQFLKRPGAIYEIVQRIVPSEGSLHAIVIEQVELEIRYEGYIRKQQLQVERAHRLEARAIPDDFDYRGVSGLRGEARERLLWHRPSTVGQASRIQGVNPADISVLLVHLERYRRLPQGE